MTRKQIDKLADKLADEYGLSPQLTFGWLLEQKLSSAFLSPSHLAKV